MKRFLKLPLKLVDPKATAGKIFLGLAGLIIGVWLFMPWEAVWSYALSRTTPKLKNVEIAWTGLDGSGPRTLKMQDVRVNVRERQFYIHELTVKIGLTRARIIADTGPKLEIMATWDKKTTIHGKTDLGALLPGNSKIKGTVGLNGDLAFPEWGKPPITGRMEITSDSLQIKQGMTAEDLLLVAELDRQDLALRTFTIEKPLPVEATGTVELDWQNLHFSPYRISGRVTAGSTVREFEKYGELRELMGSNF